MYGYVEMKYRCMAMKNKYVTEALTVTNVMKESSIDRSQKVSLYTCSLSPVKQHESVTKVLPPQRLVSCRSQALVKEYEHLRQTLLSAYSANQVSDMHSWSEYDSTAELRDTPVPPRKGCVIDFRATVEEVTILGLAKESVGKPWKECRCR